MPKIRMINIYKQTHLPEEGWFQGCFMCSQITGRTYEFNIGEEIENTKFIVYLCPNCSKLKENNAELQQQYDHHVKRYIYRHFIVR